MDAADMVDVIHYFFDEDMRYGSYESALMHSKLRERIYGGLYEKQYKYKIKDSSDAETDYSDDAGAIKPYIPPTEFNPNSPNPFGAVLDAPIG
jgi:phosphorylcholine metabolism protein LicD